MVYGCGVDYQKDKRISRVFDMNQLMVTGMHRSGTSAMTAALHKLTETPLFDDLYYCGDEFNLNGYYEIPDIVTCNERILAHTALQTYEHLKATPLISEFETLDNSSWYFGAYADLHADDYQHYVDLAKKCIEGIDSKKRILLKDPRFSLTLPIWSSVLHKPVCLVMIRNPHEVAQSLYRRNGIPREIAYQLWEIYSLSAEWNTRELPRKFVDYNELTLDRSNTLSQIYEFLINQRVEVKESSIKQAVDSIQPELRRQRYSTNGDRIPRSIANHYDRLRSLCANDSNLKNNEPSPREKLIDSTCQVGVCIALQQQLRNSTANARFNEQEKNRVERERIRAEKEKYRMECEKNNAEIERNNAEIEKNHAISQLVRLNNHIIVGTVIRLCRFLKKDATFGKV